MRQHTPGPWEVGDVDDFTEQFEVIQSGSKRQCFGCVVQRTICDGCSEADARLVAKAPELLEVLEYFIPLIESEQDDEQQAPWVEKARALIAEVKGEQEKN